jgi:predicted Zn finger-like uncharacterized protein
MTAPSRTVKCPKCSTRYLLPEEYLGASGARIRCPSCSRTFVVPVDPHGGAADTILEDEESIDAGAAAETQEPSASPLTEPVAEAGATAWTGAGEDAPKAAKHGAREEKPGAVGTEPAQDAPEADGSGTPAKAPAAKSASGGGPSASPASVAAELLDALAQGREALVSEAAQRGRLFAEFGPEIIGAFEDYRRRLGRGADLACFRDAVRERWGVDLTPPETPGG